MRGVNLLMRRSALRSLGFVSGEERRQAHRSLTQTPADDTWPLVIAGLDPAIHHLRERMEWVIRAFTPVFDDLCPRMTDEERCMAV